MPTGPYLHHPDDPRSRDGARPSTLPAALLGLVCASVLLTSAPGIALPAVFALPVLASALAVRTAARLRRRAEVRRASDRRHRRAMRVGGQALEIGAATVLLVGAVSYADTLEDPSNS